MEIHHVNTGKGDAIFCIFPDGTTMLIDAGHRLDPSDPRLTPSLPDDSRQPGEWLARYILRNLPHPEKKELDYFLLTHFHGDHMGTVAEVLPRTKKGGNYILSGLTEVAEYVPFRKLVDRAFPAYDYPRPIGGGVFRNYKSFLDWNTQNTNMQVEKFVAGTNEQFVLVNNPNKYANEFEVRNIVANLEVWTGVGNETIKHFPESFSAEQPINENILSAGIRISYGLFDYFTGGDISGKIPANDVLLDAEHLVAEVIGQVEVCDANHHAWVDAMTEYFVGCVRPQVFIIQVSHAPHLNDLTLRTMASRLIYPDRRDIFATNTHELSRLYLGASTMSRVKDSDGHIVVKVKPGGDSYHVYILDATNEESFVKAAYGPYVSR